jgi:hypothetical protein
MLPTPSIHLTLIDGDHPYPSWRLSRDRDIAHDGIFITIMYGASIGNLSLVPLLKASSEDENSQYLKGYRKGYRLLDLLAANSNLSSQLLPGFSQRFIFRFLRTSDDRKWGFLHCSETVGVLGQYLIAWFQQCCYWHPSFQCAEILQHIGGEFWEEYPGSMQADMVEQFGSILERLFRIDPGRLHFEAQATLGHLTDRYCIHVTFTIGDLAQRPIWILQQSLHHRILERDKYTTDIPEVTAQQTCTLEELITTMNPPNRDTLLRMISERNSAISGLSALRLDDRGTSEDT